MVFNPRQIDNNIEHIQSSPFRIDIVSSLKQFNNNNNRCNPSLNRSSSHFDSSAPTAVPQASAANSEIDASIQDGDNDDDENDEDEQEESIHVYEENEIIK